MSGGRAGDFMSETFLLVILLVLAGIAAVGLWRWRRSGYRFSLLALLLATAFVSLTLYVVIDFVLPTVERHRAIEFVRRSRGQFYRASFNQDGTPNPIYVRSAWESAEFVVLEDDAAVASSAHALGQIPELKSISFGQRVTDAGIKKIISPKPATAPLLLNFQCLQMSDVSLADIAQMSRLQELFFLSSSISAKGLEHLVGVQGLKTLSLWEQVGEKGNVTDRYRFGPEEYSTIAKLKDMELIRIRGHVVSDDSVRELHALKNIKRLDFVYCIVSKAAIERLRLALPECNVRASECIEPDAPKPAWF
jgi:hypothetical protein